MKRRIEAERLAGIDVGPRGLTGAEARGSLERHGANDILAPERRVLLALARDTATDPMIWFLAGTSVLYGFLGMTAEAVTLVVAAVPLALMDFLLHRRTRVSTAALAGRLASSATVIRDGRARVVAAREVVPGDLVTVAAGDSFPADGIVCGGEGLQADESSLTGEAHPVAKRPIAAMPRVPSTASPAPAEILVDAPHLAFAGTRLLTGEARVRIVWTGAETLYGEIVRSARATAARTPLQRAIGRLVLAAIGAAALLCIVLGLVRLRQGHGWVDALLSAATLAIAALPEEFPVVFTVFLGVGVYRLARRQALVRRGVSVEDIGRVTCICSDKTGTITEGRLKVAHVEPVTGGEGERLLTMAALASRRGAGDPLDEAVLEAAGGSVPEGAILATFPFTEDRRRETVMARIDGAVVAAMKGSPEVVLPRCPLAPGARNEVERRVATLASDGHKVLAVAMRSAAAAGTEPEEGYTFLGLLGIEDPVRAGVREAVGECMAAGIRTLMVTGDHPGTALAVAREIGMGRGEPVVLHGGDLEARLRDEGANALRRADVIARALPAQKLAIVRALQQAGESVAVTGDGVNDVPALQAADVGIAMGGRGTRSAREIAAIVLLDDDFRSIVRAVGEGRQLFQNLRRAFHYLLAIHIPFVLTATLVPLLGDPLLYLPIHIIWMEAIIHPAALLVFQDHPPAGPLGRAGPSRAARFFTAREWAVILTAGLLITLAVVADYEGGLARAWAPEGARAAAMATLVAASGTLTAVLSRLRTRAARWVTGVTVGGSLILIQTPSLAGPLHVAPLAVPDLLIAVVAGVLAAGLPFLPGAPRPGSEGGGPGPAGRGADRGSNRPPRP